MTDLLMPKATAVWLVDSTALTFEQIAAFCSLHDLEVQGIADGEVAVGIRGLDPISNGQLTREEIVRCEGDKTSRLSLSSPSTKLPQRTRRARYTPVSKRQDRPNAIAWLIKNYPELNDAQIGKLLGTTKSTITAVRERTHWNTPNISPQDPLLLGICSEQELLEELRKAQRRQEREAKKAAREAARKAAAKAEAAEAATPPLAQPAPETVPATDTAPAPAEAAEVASAPDSETPADAVTPIAPEAGSLIGDAPEKTGDS
ncbi:MAG: cell cycle transcriptional regulator TrcR [Pseudomonadota bacterium]|nr:cell cycle transcriptional regulator TrcR [Pseudomonadota bacterium]